jgi:regulatory protein
MKRKRPLNLEKYVLRFLTIRPRSQYELERRLTRKGYPNFDIKKMIVRLKDQNLINDREFAAAWVRNRSLLRPTGKRLLFWELKQKGIAREIIDEVLSFDDKVELDLARAALENKNRLYVGLDPFEKKQKLLAFLSRRGFAYPIAKTAIEKLKN